MTRDADDERLLDRAIDEVAHAMTQGATPDLRARVVERLDRPARLLPWWQPALAAAAVMIAVLGWWPARNEPPEPAPTASAPQSHTPPVAVVVPPAPAQAGLAVRHTRRARVPEPWPTAEPTIEPLAVAALNVDRLDTDAAEPPAVVVLAPIAMESIEFAPLEADAFTGRRP